MKIPNSSGHINTKSCLLRSVQLGLNKLINCASQTLRPCGFFPSRAQQWQMTHFPTGCHCIWKHMWMQPNIPSVLAGSTSHLPFPELLKNDFFHIFLCRAYLQAFYFTFYNCIAILLNFTAYFLIRIVSRLCVFLGVVVDALVHELMLSTDLPTWVKMPVLMHSIQGNRSRECSLAQAKI